MRSNVAERFCLGAFAIWLLWLPLPFGSNVEWARLPLIVVPLAVCAIAAVLSAGRASRLEPTRSWWIWSIGAMLFAVVVLVQLIPLPQPLLRAGSPESDTIWRSADRVASLIAQQPATPAAHPISVNPGETVRELFRFLALVAAFETSALLVRNSARRLVLASVLACGALFQMLYGLREAGLQRFAIWGWKNTLMYGRVTGTFVNPNHFADYVAITAPMGIYIAATAWHQSAPGAPFKYRVMRLIERRALLFALGALVALGCLGAILVAQSRGGLLAVGCGLLTVMAMNVGYGSKGSRARAIRRAATVSLAGIVGGALIVAILVMFLGRARTIERFRPAASEQANLVGRRTGLEAAAGIWLRFPILGSGLGSFADVVSMTQREDLEKLYNHAHDDFAEIAATTGTLGAIIALVAIAGGYVALVRSAFRRGAADGSWSRRGFQLAALASITIAMFHALFDFNFFIPANAATLAVIAGAAVPLHGAVHDDTMRTRR